MKPIWVSLLISLGLALGLHAETQIPELAPVSLNGLWAVSLGADLSYLRSDDLGALYPATELGVPDRQVFPGAFFSLRRHLSDLYYLGLGVSTLPKSYAVQVNANGDTVSYDFNTIDCYFLGGLVWYRGVNSYLYFQGEAGTAFLNQAGYTATASGGSKGAYEGSSFATAIGTGGMWFLIPSVGLNIEGGYRRAYLDSVSSNVGTIFVNDSGPYARAGLSFFWGLKNPWGDSSPLPSAPEPPQNFQSK